MCGSIRKKSKSPRYPMLRRSCAQASATGRSTPTKLYRRATLIQEQLPKVSAKPLVFGMPPPTAPLGSWTLLDAETMLVATHCTSAFPNGEIRFVEDRSGPPSRAYLKLWEALTLIGRRPGPGEKCLDLGSSPGGWSWALQQLGAQVVSVDKAPLAPAVARLPGIEHRLDSAFALDPRAIGPVDWLFCRCRLLSDAPLGTRGALARRRDLPQFRLHHQVPGRNRSCRRPAALPPFRGRSCGTCFTTSMSSPGPKSARLPSLRGAPGSALCAARGQAPRRSNLEIAAAPDGASQ